jgi:hypothetical protein
MIKQLELDLIFWEEQEELIENNESTNISK